MNRLFSAKPLLAAAIALGAVGAASTAQAHTDVALSIGIPLSGYVEQAPVYVQPQPVYVQPDPVYVAPQVTYYGGYNGYYNGWEQRRAWREHEWREHEWREHHRRDVYRAGWVDSDHDGVPNRYDRAPLNPYRR